MENNTQKTSFEDWLEEVKRLAKDFKNFTKGEIDMIDFEFEFWQSLYDEGLTPEQAIKKDSEED